MPGLVPGIHVLDEGVTVDGRDEPAMTTENGAPAEKWKPVT
jgi:hypothetical protein